MNYKDEIIINRQALNRHLKSHDKNSSNSTDLLSTHILKGQSCRGYGNWKQCVSCGASTYGGVWYLGGYKSKTEPPCDFKGATEWQKKAMPLHEYL